MQHAGVAQRGDAVLAHARAAADHHRRLGDALGVAARVVVLGLDGLDERLHRALVGLLPERELGEDPARDEQRGEHQDRGHGADEGPRDAEHEPEGRVDEHRERRLRHRAVPDAQRRHRLDEPDVADDEQPVDGLRDEGGSEERQQHVARGERHAGVGEQLAPERRVGPGRRGAHDRDHAHVHEPPAPPDAAPDPGPHGDERDADGGDEQDRRHRDRAGDGEEHRGTATDAHHAETAVGGDEQDRERDDVLPVVRWHPQRRDGGEDGTEHAHEGEVHVHAQRRLSHGATSSPVPGLDEHTRRQDRDRQQRPGLEPICWSTGLSAL